MFSAQMNPWMALVKSSAEAIRETRTPLPNDDPAILAERALLARTGEVLGNWRKGRDAWVSLVFGAAFATPFDILTPTEAAPSDAAASKE